VYPEIEFINDNWAEVGDEVFAFDAAEIVF
jgi:hypothetical protein